MFSRNVDSHFSDNGIFNGYTYDRISYSLFKVIKIAEYVFHVIGTHELVTFDILNPM